jgi:lipopolysaccharide/colanic/teichoic acid biosynthesis glycosyltransferase
MIHPLRPESKSHNDEYLKSKILIFRNGIVAYFALSLISLFPAFCFVLLIDWQKASKNFFPYIFIPYITIALIYLILYSIATTRILNGSNSYKLGQIIKRIIDIILSSCSILFTLPLFLVIAIAVKLDSKGSILIRTRRIGQFGKPFDEYKFRTTKIKTTKQEVTRIGKFLRDTDLDKFPNYYNILEGEMSYVGPWARTPDLVATTIDSEQMILSIKPGLTGLSQISKVSKSEMMEYDLDYLKNWSLLLDIKIIIDTVIVVMFNTKKQEKRH